MGPLFSILHSSARPHQWRKVYDAWISSAVNPEQVEYVLCVDTRWGFQLPMPELDNWVPERVLPGVGEEIPSYRNILVWNNLRRCYVDGVNGAAKFSSGRILIVNADDQYPCEGWDEKLSTLDRDSFWFEERHPKEFVIEVSTLTPNEHERKILVMPILSRARYERFGYVFYPEYESMFADNDFCEAAQQDNCIIDARHLVFPHRHPLLDGKGGWRQPNLNEWDAAYQAQNDRAPGGAWTKGEQILARRRARRFPDPVAQPRFPENWKQKAEAIPGWMTADELEWLHETAGRMDSWAEIGCWKGRSTLVVLDACKGNVYAVDHFKGSNEPEHIAEVASLGGSTYPEFEKNVGHYPNLIPVQFPSLDAVKIVPDVDCVFIDGSHDYASVKADLEAWKGKAKKLLAGHDQDYPDVARAVREVLGSVVRGPNGIWYKPMAEKRLVFCLSGELYRREWMRNILASAVQLSKKGYQIAIVDEYSTQVAVTRNKLVEDLAFLENAGMLNPEDLVLWLDDDNVLSPELLFQLLDDLDARPDVHGVCGWCWIHDEHTQVFSVSAGEFTPDSLHWIHFNPRTFPLEREPRLMECGGFPCVLMRYEVFQKIGQWPFRHVLDDRMTFGMSGEDMAFWMNAQKAGLKFLVDPRVMVPHFKYMLAAPQFPEENAPVPVVACMMRVKNEARWITRAIESVKELCGEHIYILEDGSTDGTPELIEAAGAHLIESPFAGQGLDETRDKDYLMGYVVEDCNPHWILCIDGDEALEPGGCRKILDYLKGNPNTDYIGLRFVNLWDGFDQARTDGVYAGMVRQSLFRPGPDLTFKSYYDHEGGKNHVGLHCGNTPYAPDFQAINVFLLHYGCLYKEDRIRKYRWMVSIDPHNEFEDGYRHMVQGDIPEVPADMKLKHGGPLEIRKLPRRLVLPFDKEPGPAKISGSALVEDEAQDVPKATEAPKEDTAGNGRGNTEAHGHQGPQPPRPSAESDLEVTLR